jgi:hypothetical protein
MSVELWVVFTGLPSGPLIVTPFRSLRADPCHPAADAPAADDPAAAAPAAAVPAAAAPEAAVPAAAPPDSLAPAAGPGLGGHRPWAAIGRPLAGRGAASNRALPSMIDPQYS